MAPRKDSRRLGLRFRIATNRKQSFQSTSSTLSMPMGGPLAKCCLEDRNWLSLIFIPPPNNLVALARGRYFCPPSDLRKVSIELKNSKLSPADQHMFRRAT